ncbi:hypothetical protein PENTCL1PPCAC_18151, partial [Pristionchus entomophagus]
LLPLVTLSHTDPETFDPPAPPKEGKEKEKKIAPYTEAEELAFVPQEDRDEIIFTLSYTIQTSYCLEAETQSGFELWSGSLDNYGQLLWIGKLTRDSCRVRQTDDNRFEGQATFIASRTDVIECIQGGNSDACDPRGEVVFIDMREEYVDDWSIEMITVNSQFEYDLVTYNTSFEHSILVPCKTRLNEPAIYQIGPASGQMIKLTELPKAMDWISDHF